MRRTKRNANLRALLVVAMVVILAFSLIACDKTGDEQSVNPTSISIEGKPAGNTLEEGASPVALSYVVTPSDASGFEVEWSVEDENVATISQNGTLTAVSQGETAVSVKIKNTNIQDSFVLTVTAKEPTINDLLGDLILRGVYNENAPEIERVPLDPDYVKLVTRRESLMLGESYVETFDRGDFLDTKLFPVRSSQGVTATISDENGFIGSNGRVLCFETPLPYSGVYLAGMQFVAGARYTIEMDYNVISASNLFYFQFRSYSAGTESDVYVTLPTSETGVGKLVADITLKNYSDYEIMIFCGDRGGGKIAIDNLKITREELLQEENTENFDTAVENLVWSPIGSATVEKSETTIEQGTERSLRVVTNGNGEGVEFILDGTFYKDVEYNVTFALRATSLDGTLTVNLGADVLVDATTGFDNVVSLTITPSESTNKLRFVTSQESEMYIDTLSVKELIPELADGEQPANTQNFENKGGMAYSNNNDAKLTLTKAGLSAGASGNALRLQSLGEYAGVLFDADVVVGNTYKVSFKLNLIDNPNNSIFYVQLGGGGDYKQFDFAYPCASYDAETGYVSFILTANTSQLQIFAKSAGLVMVIDDVAIEEAVLQPSNTENFDGEQSMPYAKNENATLAITEDSSIMPAGASGKALHVVSGAQYGGVMLETSALDNSKSYFVSFNIKINVSNGSFVYVKLGNGEAKRLDPNYTWDSMAIYDSVNGYVGYVLVPNGNNLVIFANAGGVDFVIDNVSVTEYDAQAQETLCENFDGASNIGVSSNNAAQLQYVTSDQYPQVDGKGLLVRGMENYAGVVLKLPVVLETGATYDVSFTFAVTDGYTGPFWLQQLNQSAAFQFDASSVSGGKITGTITIVADSNTIIQIFSQNASEFVIDDITFAKQEAPKNYVSSKEVPFTSVESEQSNIYAWASANNQAEVTSSLVTITSDEAEAYAGAWIRLPMTFETGNNYRIVFETNATHGLYVNVDGGTDTPVSAINGRVSVVLAGVADKHCIRVFANNTPSANYTITNLYVENIGTYVTTENFDTWSNNQIDLSNAFAVPNPYSGENVPAITLSEGKITVTGKDASDYYGVYIKLDVVLDSAKQYVISFDFEGDYSPYVKAGSEVQATPEGGRISVTVQGGGSNEIRIMTPSASNVVFTIDNVTLAEQTEI